MHNCRKTPTEIGAKLGLGPEYVLAFLIDREGYPGRIVGNAGPTGSNARKAYHAGARELAKADSGRDRYGRRTVTLPKLKCLEDTQ